jgi:hypothetical protein
MESVCAFTRVNIRLHISTPSTPNMRPFSISPPRLIEGWLPNRARSLVLDWAAQHRDELFTAWEQIRSGRTPAKIAPLE